MFREARYQIRVNFVSVVVSRISRECNSCAHEIARSALVWNPDQSCVWPDPLPDFVTQLVVRDAEPRMNE